VVGLRFSIICWLWKKCYTECSTVNRHARAFVCPWCSELMATGTQSTLWLAIRLLLQLLPSGVPDHHTTQRMFRVARSHILHYRHARSLKRSAARQNYTHAAARLTHTHTVMRAISHHWTIYRTCATHCLLSHPDSLGLMFSIYSPYVCLGPKRRSDLRPTVYSCSHAAIREKVLDTMLTKLVFHNAVMLGIFLWMWISSV